jgi:hypothetical protein
MTTLGTVCLVVWIIGAVIMGAICGRDVWTGGTQDGVRPHNPVFTPFAAVLFGIMWPVPGVAAQNLNGEHWRRTAPTWFYRH